MDDISQWSEDYEEEEDNEDEDDLNQTYTVEEDPIPAPISPGG